MASKLAGGKAEQGALLAAMEFLYNEHANGSWGGEDRGDARQSRLASIVDKYLDWRQGNLDELSAASAGDARAGMATALGVISPYSVGARVAMGHAFEKHVLGVDAIAGDPLFRGLGIRTTAQLATHIDSVIANPTSAKALSRGRMAYLDAATSTVVIINPRAADMGSVFQPKFSARRYFDGLK